MYNFEISRYVILFKMTNDLVTVVIPSYNHDKYILECINSVLNQTYENIELIIIDDGSIDKTRELLSKLESQNKKNIKIIFKDNEGLINTLNGSYELINGKYVAFLASDDIWLPNKIEEQINIISRYSNVGFIFSDSFFLCRDQKTDVLYSSYKKKLNKIEPNEPIEIYKFLLRNNFIATPTVLIRTSCLKQVGFFDKELGIEDYDMWLRLSKNNKTVYINKPLSYYRLHNKNFSKQIRPMLLGTLRTLDKHLNIDLTRPLRKTLDKFLFLLCALFYKIKKYHIIKHMKMNFKKRENQK